MSLNDKNPDYWYLLATHDLETVELLLKENGYPDIIVYHMHQAVEKKLKGRILESRQTFPSIHDLERLYRILFESDNMILKDIVILNSFYREMRYPTSNLLNIDDLSTALKSFRNIWGHL